VISPTSRYVQGETLWVKTKKRGNKQTVYLDTVTVVNRPYMLVLMRETDNMTIVSAKSYNDPQRWWVVADANPQWFYPMDNFPGWSLRVPR